MPELTTCPCTRPNASKGTVDLVARLLRDESNRLDAELYELRRAGDWRKANELKTLIRGARIAVDELSDALIPVEG